MRCNFGAGQRQVGGKGGRDGGVAAQSFLGRLPAVVARIGLAPAQPDGSAHQFQSRAVGVDGAHRGRGGPDVARGVGEAEGIAAVGGKDIVVLAVMGRILVFIQSQIAGVQDGDGFLAGYQIGVDGSLGQAAVLAARRIFHGGSRGVAVHAGEGEGQGRGGVAGGVHQIDVDGAAGVPAGPGDGGGGQAQTGDAVAGVVIAGDGGTAAPDDQVHRGIILDGKDHPYPLAGEGQHIAGDAAHGQLTAGQQRIVAVDLLPDAGLLDVQARLVGGGRDICRRFGALLIHHGPGQGGGDLGGVAHLVGDAEGEAVPLGRAVGEDITGLAHQQLIAQQGGGHRAGHAFRAAPGVQKPAVRAVEGYGDGLHGVVDVGDLHGVGVLPHGDGDRIVLPQLQGGGGAGDFRVAVLAGGDAGEGAAAGGGGGEGHRPPGGSGLGQGHRQVLPEGGGGDILGVQVPEGVLILDGGGAGVDGQGMFLGKGAGGIRGYRVQHPDGLVGGDGNQPVLYRAHRDGGGGGGVGVSSHGPFLGVLADRGGVAGVVLAGHGDGHAACRAVGEHAVDGKRNRGVVGTFGGDLVNAVVVGAVSAPGAVEGEFRQGDGGRRPVFVGKGEDEAAQINPAVVRIAQRLRDGGVQGVPSLGRRAADIIAVIDRGRHDIHRLPHQQVAGPGDVPVAVVQPEIKFLGPVFLHFRQGQLKAQVAVQGDGAQLAAELCIDGPAVEEQLLLGILVRGELDADAAVLMGDDLGRDGEGLVDHQDGQGLFHIGDAVDMGAAVMQDVLPLVEIEGAAVGGGGDVRHLQLHLALGVVAEVVGGGDHLVRIVLAPDLNGLVGQQGGRFGIALAELEGQRAAGGARHANGELGGLGGQTLAPDSLAVIFLRIAVGVEVCQERPVVHVERDGIVGLVLLRDARGVPDAAVQAY